MKNCFTFEIRSAVLVIHGEKTHSRYFSEDAFGKLTGDNKELMIIPDSVHTDLYDRMDIIPDAKNTVSFSIFPVIKQVDYIINFIFMI